MKTMTLPGEIPNSSKCHPKGSRAEGICILGVVAHFRLECFSGPLILLRASLRWQVPPSHGTIILSFWQGKLARRFGFL